MKKGQITLSKSIIVDFAADDDLAGEESVVNSWLEEIYLKFPVRLKAGLISLNCSMILYILQTIYQYYLDLVLKLV